jgi:hypothetical protein
MSKDRPVNCRNLNVDLHYHKHDGLSWEWVVAVVAVVATVFFLGGRMTAPKSSEVLAAIEAKEARAEERHEEEQEWVLAVVTGMEMANAIATDLAFKSYCGGCVDDQ